MQQLAWFSCTVCVHPMFHARLDLIISISSISIWLHARQPCQCFKSSHRKAGTKWCIWQWGKRNNSPLLSPYILYFIISLLRWWVFRALDSWLGGGVSIGVVVILGYFERCLSYIVCCGFRGVLLAICWVEISKEFIQLQFCLK